MKTMFRFLPLAALLVSSHLQALPAASRPPPSPLVVTCGTYAEGQAHGAEDRASFELQYGAVTPAFYDALNQAKAHATYEARNSECPLYWRGVNTGLGY